MFKRYTFLFLFFIGLSSIGWGQSATVTLRPSHVDLSSATSYGAVLMTLSGYSSNDAKYRLFNTTQYNCWNGSTFVTATAYSSGPSVPGTPSTSSTFWIIYQRGTNNTTAASYRDRLGTGYTSNYQTIALPAATAITSPFTLSGSVSAAGGYTLTNRYVVLGYDATTGGNLLCATSTELTNGSFSLVCNGGANIKRIEIRDLNNTLMNIILSPTAGWTTTTTSVNEPTVAASGSPVTLTDANSMTLNWTNGNGEKRIVLVRSGTAVDQAPSDGTPYSANSIFGSGAQVGTGNYVVYNGSGNSVVVTGLTTGITYHVAIYEYNGASLDYLTSSNLTGSGTTVSSGTPTITVSTSNLTFGNVLVGSESTVLYFDVSGTDLDGTDIIVVCPTDFQISQNEGSGYSTDPITFAYGGTDLTLSRVYVKFTPGSPGAKSTTVDISGGDADGKTVTVSGKGIALEPDMQASAATVISASGTSLNLDWTNGNGSGRIVLMKQGSAVDGVPVDGTSYSAGLEFQAGTQIGTGNYVVYAGSDSKPITVTGLTVGMTYHISVFEFNGTGQGENYLTSSPATSNGATLKITAGAISTSPFCVDASTSANGTIAFTVTGVFGVANDYVAYLSDTSGSFVGEVNIGTLTNTTGDGTINITIPAGTPSGTGYKIRIKSNDPVEVISTESAELQVINGVSVVSSTVATNGNTQSVVSWTNPTGCFDQILIVAKAGSAVTASPSGDGSSYTGDLTFGSGTAFDGGFIVYKGTTSPETVTGLTNDITYHFSFFTRRGTTWSTGVSTTAKPSSGTLLLEENFNYPATELLTANGYTASSGTGTNNIAVGSNNGLTFTNYGPVSPGNAVTLNTNGQDVYKTFTAQTSGIIYTAFLVNVATATTSGDYFINLSDNPWTTNYRGRVFTKRDASNNVAFGLAVSGTAQYTGFDYALGTTYLLVLKYEIVPGTQNDKVSLQVYSNGDNFETEPVTLTINNLTELVNDATNIGAYQIRQGSTASGPTLTIDAIRISTGWFGQNGALPVELTSFTASAKGTSVILNWETKTEVDNNGFEVERNSTGTWQKIGFVEGHGTANSPKYYSFSDNSVLGNKIQYRLKQIDNDGAFEYSPTVEVELNPTQFALYQNYPNPFNPSTIIRYSMPVGGNVSIEVYNTLGEKITSLVNSQVEAGYHEVSFDATNLPSGLYFYKINTDGYTSVKKMLLMK